MQIPTTARERASARVATFDVVVIGAGLSGIAAAVTAARGGAAVALVGERPVLGGNASSEIRVSPEGANGGGHNRFYVESGLAEDLLIRNFWRNPTGSPEHWSALLYELVMGTPGLTLYLDTTVHQLRAEGTRIVSVEALTLGDERAWSFTAPYFVDATGDGSIGYLAGAEFMYGEEGRDTFGEPLAPAEATNLTLGGTMQFMAKDTGRPVLFERPSFARKVQPSELHMHRTPDVWGQAPVLGGFWWIEYGGALETIGDNEEIKRVLLAEVFGVWDHVKNDPRWRERNATLDLEWVSTMPGKRESRRIVGDHILTEQDIAETRRFDDAVAFGGWSIDRHTPGGFFDFDRLPCVQVHPPSIYQIPLRSLYARDIENLYLAGRDISASHVACCSSRVMLTCTHIGEAVGAAAALSVRHRATPREISDNQGLFGELRRELQRLGHYIPFVPIEVDRMPAGTIVTASTLLAGGDPAVTSLVPLDAPMMLSLPLPTGKLDRLELWLQLGERGLLRWRAHRRHSNGTWLPGDLLAEGQVEVPADPSGGWVVIEPRLSVEPSSYVHVAFALEIGHGNIGVNVERLLGPLTWRSVTGALDEVPADRREELGWDLPRALEEGGDAAAFVFGQWRRVSRGWGGPPSPSIAHRVTPEQAPAAESLLEPFERPTPTGVHAWVTAIAPGDLDDGRYRFRQPPVLTLQPPRSTEAAYVEFYLNSDLERHLAATWYSHPPGERALPTILADFDVLITDAGGETDTIRIRSNYERRVRVPIKQSVAAISVVCLATHGARFASILDVRLMARQQPHETAESSAG